ncbi:unnamed protein product [Coregonus sp. 'balchen']|nr:unnamed protein product [Coregonus sp. 'balchen']
MTSHPHWEAQGGYTSAQTRRSPVHITIEMANAWTGERGSIKPKADFNAKDDAVALSKAMKGLEQTWVQILASSRTDLGSNTGLYKREDLNRCSNSEE